MSDTGKFAMELAEARVEQERDASVARAQAALRRQGSDDCEDCGRDIGAGRRRAMPSARNCIQCATAKEQGRR